MQNCIILPKMLDMYQISPFCSHQIETHGLIIGPKEPWAKIQRIQELKRSVSVSVEFQLLSADNYLRANITVMSF